MKSIFKIVYIVFCIVFTFVSLCSCNAKTGFNENAVKISVAVPQSPSSYPLMYMIKNNSMQDFAVETQLIPYSSNDELNQMAVSNQVHFMIAPITEAIKIYNKGVNVRLLGVTLWGAPYVISSDKFLNDIQDLRDKEIAVSKEGCLPDLILRHILIGNGLNPDINLKITYMNEADISNKLSAGEILYSVSDVNDSASILTYTNYYYFRKDGFDIKKRLSLEEYWYKLTGKPGKKIPIEALIAVGDTIENEEMVMEFLNKFREGTKWINSNTSEMKHIAIEYFPEYEEQEIFESLEYANLKFVSPKESKKDIEEFFNELLKTTSIDIINAKLPDDNFYYK
ncbi:hypothetical protein OXPF_02760 [Oxobacter pfennigii]|uniref:NMT1/THI5 like protein n=1 Tax=Oxobacter pfennigii TaxID=36849 RepID=A0A0P8X5N2_9CLOT|nr:ABC transporter substrate-binding protein [Oxobacter pfennigii]KPU46166.1 hypothetical protein OXPF_02760 [Oxobacter pfennigii]